MATKAIDFSHQPPGTTASMLGNTHFGLPTGGCITLSIMGNAWAMCAWCDVKNLNKMVNEQLASPKRNPVTVQQPHFWFADAEAPLSSLLRMAPLNRAREFPIVRFDLLSLHTSQIPTNRSRQTGRVLGYEKYQVRETFWLLTVILLTVKLIPMVSCWRRSLSVMSSSRQLMDGFSRLIAGDKPHRTRAGHTCPAHSQSLALAIGTPLYIPRRQYRAPCAKDKHMSKKLKRICFRASSDHPCQVRTKNNNIEYLNK